MTETVVEMKHITKRFGRFVANDDISLSVKKGEIVALLGENGAGKSTLMSLLSGLKKPSSGEILINNKVVTLASPRQATQHGIGMVHQHFMLIDDFTVLENIILGDEKTKHGMIDYASIRKTITELAEKYHLQLDLDKKVADISVGMQQRVEIMKTLYRDAKILIFDEPTAALTPQEIDSLLIIIKRLASEGKAIFLITHKLSEIKAVADTCVVVRAGKVIGTVTVAETSTDMMAEMMVGRQVNFTAEKVPTNQTKLVLELDHLTVKADKAVASVNDVSLKIATGEILGIAGIDGNGQSELMEAITGLRKVSKGTIKLNGTDITKFKPRKTTQAGISNIPEDRQNVGLILPMSVSDNLILQDYYLPGNQSKGLLNKHKIKQDGQKLMSEFDIRAESIAEPVGSLSGGNQQKVIIAREISRNPDLLIAANPTRGLDVGAIEYVHKQILKQRENGKAILLVSFELDELLKLSDRIAVIHQGKIMGTVKTEGVTKQELGFMMAGQAMPTH
ncbi:ABC transporter ATP-binding protein [Dellaglioa sp. BT-FLS60]